MNIKRMGSQVIDGEKKFVKDKSDKENKLVVTSGERKGCRGSIGVGD